MVGQSYVLSTLTSKHVFLISTVFFQFDLEEGWSMDAQGGIKARAQYCGFDTPS